MRITLLSRDFPPAISGIGDYTDRVAGELAARGHVVTVLCSGPAEDRASFEVRPIVTSWDRRGLASISRAVAASKPEVVLWQYNPFSIGRRGLAPSAGRLARTLASHAPLVVCFHELWFPWRRGGLRGFVWAVAQRVQARGVMRAARAWIVTTKKREHHLTRTDAAKVHRIPIGSNIDALGSSGRAALGLPDDAFVVAHMGTLGPGKDLEPAFDAIRRLRGWGVDARLLLAGRTGDFRRPQDLNGALVTTGTLADLSPALSAADAYLHPDPAGPAAGRRGSLVAALAHALPIVSYRGADHDPELVEGRNLVLTEPDGASLAHALAALAAAPERRRAMADAARAAFEHSFTWPRVAEAVEDVLVRVGR